MNSAIERRQHPRLMGEFPVELLNMGDDPHSSQWEAIITGTALDVSQHGMRVRTNYDAEVGDLLAVIFYLNGHGSVCVCEIKWKKQERAENVYGIFIKEWSQMDSQLAARLESLRSPSSSSLNQLSLVAA